MVWANHEKLLDLICVYSPESYLGDLFKREEFAELEIAVVRAYNGDESTTYTLYASFDSEEAKRLRDERNARESDEVAYLLTCTADDLVHADAYDNEMKEELSPEDRSIIYTHLEMALGRLIN